MSRLAQPAIRCLIGLLIVLSAAVYADGLGMSWVRDGDGDMQQRLKQYLWLREGVYPTKKLEPDVSKRTYMRHMVYPPYALPTFAPFFERGGKIQGRVLTRSFSFAALAGIAAHGFHLLQPTVREAAAV